MSLSTLHAGEHPGPARLRMPLAVFFVLGLWWDLCGLSKVNKTAITMMGVAGIGAFLGAAPWLLLVAQARRRWPRCLRAFAPVAACLILVYACALARRQDLRGVIVVGQFVTLCCYFALLCMVQWDGRGLHVLAITMTFGQIFLTLLWIATGHHIAESDGPIHSNVLAAISFSIGLLHAYALLGRENHPWRAFHIACIVFSVCVIIVTLARSQWLALVGFATLYRIWPWLIRKRLRFRCCVLLMIMGCLGTTYLYPHMRDYPVFDRIEGVLSENSGKDLYSGRDRIWRYLLHLVAEEPLKGYGAGALPVDFIEDTELSSHNLYIQVALQVGLPGVLLLFACLASVWLAFWEGRYSPHVRIAAAALAGLFVQQTFEISLTQNDLAVGLLQWMVLAIGLSKCPSVPAV